VLLAEDEPTQCLFVSRLLTCAGYVVDVVNDGESALAAVSTGDYQILITDWDMPRMDGPTLCRQIRKLALPGYLYILILTGRDSPQNVVSGLDAGADDYIRKPPVEAELVARLGAGRRVVRLEQSLRASNARAHLLSITDGLLSVFNRRYVNEKLPDEIQRSSRYRRPLSVVIADIDHFKRINDRFGHQIGDEVLKCVTRLMQSQLRKSCDWIARFGGEEFLLVLPDSANPGAMATAERIREACGSTPLVTSAGEVTVTVSFGVAEFKHDGDDLPGARMDTLLRRADAALYQSKAAGRNQVTQADLQAHTSSI
jgi:diguanylate cyclase (GGDEF)-like protein